MRHLLSYTVYQGRDLFGNDPRAVLDSIGADGVELLTSYEDPDPWFSPITESVHLPYATDWLAAWQGRPHEMPDDYVRYYMYGRDRDSIVSTVREGIEHASVIHPAYGVLHAGNGDIEGLYLHSPRRDDREVLDAFAEMVNAVVSRFPGGEPPFRILFENLWWAGLRLLDDSDFCYLADRLEFDNWGICLDTGHMMNCLPDINTQRDGIDALRRVFSGYCQELIDRIETIHFHWSASYPYRSTFTEREPGDDLMGFISEAYPHISRIDQHMPFSDPACLDLVEILDPEYVTYEMSGSEKGILEDFRKQRSLFGIF